MECVKLGLPIALAKASTEPWATSCTCKHNCDRDKGRSVCPCKVLGKACTDMCTCGNIGRKSVPCKNRIIIKPGNFKKQKIYNSESEEEIESSNSSLPTSDDETSFMKIGESEGDEFEEDYIPSASFEELEMDDDDDEKNKKSLITKKPKVAKKLNFSKRENEETDSQELGYKKKGAHSKKPTVVKRKKMGSRVLKDAMNTIDPQFMDNLTSSLDEHHNQLDALIDRMPVESKETLLRNISRLLPEFEIMAKEVLGEIMPQTESDIEDNRNQWANWKEKNPSFSLNFETQKRGKPLLDCEFLNLNSPKMQVKNFQINTTKYSRRGPEKVCVWQMPRNAYIN